MLNGKFIVIEGTDGTGKKTQLDLAAQSLENAGYKVKKFDFPQYGLPSAHLVERYLNGDYGKLEEIAPEEGAIFYAVDRYDARRNIEQALSEGFVVLCNRYVASNLAHSAAKISDLESRIKFYQWNENLEFDILNIPEPDLNIVLSLDPAVAYDLVAQKSERSYTTKTRDIAEENIDHQMKASLAYRELADHSRQRYTLIDCNDTEQGIQSKELIHEQVLHVLTALQDEREPEVANTPNQHTEPEDSHLLEKVDGHYVVTAAGKAFLQNAITNTTDNVYAFTGEMSPITIAAAMARLSRRGDDMRVTLLDEFAGQAGKDENLLKRVITAYGDDSVQQLTGIHLVVENASNLLTKKLEWGRLAAYLEQSTRYIYFDQKDPEGNYRYFTPINLDPSTSNHYKTTMDKIFDNYSEMVHKLTEYVRGNSGTPKDEQDVAWKGATRAQACDAIRPVLPVSTTSTVGIFGSGQAIEALIMRLRGDASLEAQKTGDQILEEVRKVAPTFFERADKPDRGGATTAYMSTNRKHMHDHAEEKLPAMSASYPPVDLVDVTIRNELDLVPYMLYEQSALSFREIQQEVSTWSFEDKATVFDQYMGERLNRRHKPGRALEHAHYTWDLVCDYGIFRDLQRHRMVDGLEWQQLTPRYGYEVPELVEEAGLADLFEECFDLSYELYSRLQALGFYEEAQYATLMGHRMRWKIMYNARQAFHFHELRSAPQGHPGYRKLINQMHERLSEVHPMIAAHMKFVNKDEDPALTRLAAERYTQFKLNQLK